MGTFTAGTTLPSPILTHPARSYPARSCLPSQLHPARHDRRPGPPSPPTRPAKPANPAGPASPPTQPAILADSALRAHDQARHSSQPCPPCPLTLPAMPADPACQACQPAQQTRPAGTSPLLRQRCSRPCQPRIFQLPAHQRQLAHFPLLLSKNVAISGDPPKNVAIARVRNYAPLHAHRRRR